MLLDSEQRRLPSVDVVALRAFAFLWAGVELAFVWIRGVAVFASRKGELLFKVTIEVTSDAGDLGVLTEQRVLGLGVIEIETRKNGFPTAGGVASVASFLERALVRIDMASGAGVELYVLVASWSAGHIGLVTFFARHFDVQASERVASFGMVEILGRFPALNVMALGALVAQLAFVRIGVAGNAIR